MRRAKRVFLGNSLTSNLLAANEDLIVDVWEGGSDLYGWTLDFGCVDRVPIFLPRRCCPQLLTGPQVEVDVSLTVEGPESGLKDKFGDVARTVLWLNGRLIIPARPLCENFRSLLHRSKARKIFSPLSKVDLDSRILRTYHCDVEYEELINTLPLDYLLSKAGLDDLRKHLSYRSAHVILMAAETKLKDYAKIFVGHKGYSLGYIVSYGETPLGKLVYAFTPLTRESMRAELTGRSLSELKRLKVIDGPVRFLRSYFIKYFILSGEPNIALEVLKSKGVALAGRYGRWMDLSLCDICH